MKRIDILAPAKLTWSLRVEGRRDDGYHDLVAEMLTIDLADRLVIGGPGDSLDLRAEAGTRAAGLELGEQNLVRRALALAGRSAAVSLHKAIPVGAGLGGGSADAAAVLRWAGVDDLDQAATLGGDVPFCLVGGRAMVRGIGEQVEPLSFISRSVLLLLPPFGVDTASAYLALDELRAAGPWTHERNDLRPAAERVEPRLVAWRRALEEAAGCEAVLAGSGSTLFVEGSRAERQLEGVDELVVGGLRGALIEVATIEASAGAPSEAS